MLEVKNLEVKYQNIILGVKDVSLQVPERSKVAFLGANGAGKTTTIRALTGLLKFHGGKVTNGQILFWGKDITNLDAKKITGIGIIQVPEGRHIFSQLSTDENLLVGSASNPLNRSSRLKLAAKIYEYFPRLYDRKGIQAGYLSGGEQQMLAIGRALMARPRLLVIDELSLGLAPIIISDLAKTLLEVNKQEGISILLVEQNARMALDFAEFGYIIENGQSFANGPSEQLKQDEKVNEAYLGFN